MHVGVDQATMSKSHGPPNFLTDASDRLITGFVVEPSDDMSPGPITFVHDTPRPPAWVKRL